MWRRRVVWQMAIKFRKNLLSPTSGSALLFYHEDKGSTFLTKLGIHPPDNTA